MNRRGHMSAKVPNVKLRPNTRRHSALPLDEDTAIVENAWDEAMEEDEAGPSNSSVDLPWRGICVTFTGVEDKPALTTTVRKLGGEVESALTVKVTHVVAPFYGSPKYLYAVEHRIPVLAPSWIHDAHTRWLKGEELDVPASIEAHRQQPFIGLKIAISGIEDLDRRRAIVKLVREYGGVYSKDLDRSCTHLVSAWSTRDKSHQSEKVKWVTKNLGERDAARRKGKRFDDEDIHVVYEEWFWDCVAYRGRWPEKDYDARKPRAQGKVTAEEVLDGSVFARLAPKAPTPPIEPGEDEPVVVRKRKRDDDVVGQLLASSGIILAKPSGSDNADSAEPQDAVKGSEAVPRRSNQFERTASRLHASRAESFAQPASAGPSRPTSVPPLADAEPSHSPSAPLLANGEPSLPLPTSKKIYSGLRISHAVAENPEALEDALHTLGAHLVPEGERLAGAPVNYVIVRLGSNAPLPLPDVDPQPTVVTECWVEACAFENRLIPVDDHFIFRPLTFPTPIANADGITVHVTGFGTQEGTFLRRMIKALGFGLDKMLRRSTSVVVLHSPAGKKFEKAVEWGLARVDESWVWTIAKEGGIVPMSEHPLNANADGEAAVTEPAAKPAAETTAGPTGEPAAEAAAEGEHTPRATKVRKIDDSGAKTSGPPTPTGRNALSASRVLSNTTRGSRRSLSAPKSHAASPANSEVMPSGAEDDVNAQLRRLAEPEDGARSMLPPPRRLLSRPTGSTSSSSTASRGNVMSPVEAQVATLPTVEDESMRVTYADAASEKEKRQLLAAVMRGSGGADGGKRRR